MGGGGRGEPGPPANGAVTPPATKQTLAHTHHTYNTQPLTYAAGGQAPTQRSSTLDGPAARAPTDPTLIITCFAFRGIN